MIGHYMEMHTPVLYGLTADNAYQSKNPAMRSKELPAELRDRIVSRHRSGNMLNGLLVSAQQKS